MIITTEPRVILSGIVGLLKMGFKTTFQPPQCQKVVKWFCDRSPLPLLLTLVEPAKYGTTDGPHPALIAVQ